MANDGDDFSGGAHSRGTLRIKSLLATQLKLFRLELVGQDHPLLIRAGALLLFGPFLLVGYAFTLASLVRLLAIRIGWGVGLLLVGLIHLAVGAWGVRRGRALVLAQSYNVVAPECESDGAATGRFDFDNALTLPSLRPSRPELGPAFGGGYPRPVI